MLERGGCLPLPPGLKIEQVPHHPVHLGADLLR
jgi:hypothetical protein